MGTYFAKKRKSVRGGAFLLLCFLLLGQLFPAKNAIAVAPSNIITYQGRLLNASRVPVSSTSASMVFELYTASSGGTCVWSNSSASCATATARTVTLTDGLFSENLGDTSASYAAIGDSIFGNNASLYLQITINSETLTPRKLITASPYALNAQMLDGLDADTDGATSSAVAAFNSSGNFVVTGNPGGSGISQGSLYVNPAALDVSANDMLFGVANGGTARFSVDAEGDGDFAGDVTLGTLTTEDGVLTSTVATANIFDDASGGTTIDIGGVTTDLGNTINIGTNSTTADAISIGNVAVGSTLALASQTWTISTAGTGTFVDVACTDCLDFDTFGDTLTLDASTTLALSSSNFVYDLTSTGDLLVKDNGTTFLTISDTGGYAYTVNGSAAYMVTSATSGDVGFNVTETGSFVIQADGSDVFNILQSGSYEITLANSAAYSMNVNGSGNALTNLAGTGAFEIADNGTMFFSINDTGAYAYTLDATDNPAYTITNSGSGNVTTNLAGTGDFIIQDNGTAFVTFSDTGTAAFTGSLDVDGDSTFGDTTGTDEFTFTSADTTQTAFSITTNELTSGMGLSVTRDATGAGDFDGTLLNVSQTETSVGSDGIALSIGNAGGGNSVGLYITQAQVVDATTAPTAQALVIDVRETQSSDEVILIRSDSAGTPDAEFRFENDGDLFGDGAAYNAGADYAEFFPITDRTIGDYEVVCWNGALSLGVKRCEPGTNAPIGVISTNPGFVGNNFVGAEGNLEDNPQYALVGLVGQIETKVALDGGEIHIGDPLSISSLHAGYAAKAKGGSYIIGRALENFNQETGVIRVLVQPMWYGGEMLTHTGIPTAPDEGTALIVGGGESVESDDATQSSGFVSQDIDVLNIAQVLNMTGGDIVSIGTLAGIGDAWKIEEDGDFITTGKLTQLVYSAQREQVPTYAVTSPEVTVELSGSTQLHNGMARVRFDAYNEVFNDIISPEAPYRVLATPSGVTGQVYVTDRSNEGFVIRDSAGTEGVFVDWLVIAYRIDAQLPEYTQVTIDELPVATESEVPNVVDPVETSRGDVSEPESETEAETIVDPVVDTVETSPSDVSEPETETEIIIDPVVDLVDLVDPVETSPSDVSEPEPDVATNPIIEPEPVIDTPPETQE